MSFYNPNMKGPDFGQGISSAMEQLVQMLALKKYGKTPGKVPTEPMEPLMQNMEQDPKTGMGLQGLGAIPMPSAAQGGGGGGMDMAQLQKLMQLLQTLKMGGGGGMMGGAGMGMGGGL
jgi:hypothetical protein